MPTDFPSLVSLPEIARVLNVSPKTIYYWVKRNEIPYVRVGRHLRFKPIEVIDFFESQTRGLVGACHPSGPAVKSDLCCSLTVRRSTRNRQPALRKEQGNGGN